MSQRFLETVECPYCLSKGDFEFWDSVNVDLNPELRERLFNEELFVYHCDKCGHDSMVPYGMIYHDMTHGFMLFFDFEKSPDSEHDDLILPDPEQMGVRNNYIFRIVYGLDALKEKILILEHELNDVAIERMKYFISHVTYPDLTENGYELYFVGERYTGKGYDKKSIVFYYQDDKELDMEIEVSKDEYYEYCLACEVDPRMSVSKCQCVDAEWMDLQLKEE